MTEAVAVATTRFPWEDPAVEVEAAHFEACARFLQRAANAWKKPQQDAE